MELYSVSTTEKGPTREATQDSTCSPSFQNVMSTLQCMLPVCPDAMKRPKTPCERARDAVINGPPGVYVPTCDCQGEYTPEQHWGSTG